VKRSRICRRCEKDEVLRLRKEILRFLRISPAGSRPQTGSSWSEATELNQRVIRAEAANVPKRVPQEQNSVKRSRISSGLERSDRIKSSAPQRCFLPAVYNRLTFRGSQAQGRPRLRDFRFIPPGLPAL